MTTPEETLNQRIYRKLGELIEQLLDMLESGNGRPAPTWEFIAAAIQWLELGDRINQGKS